MGNPPVDTLFPRPDELVPPDGAPSTIAGWKALAEGLLTEESCVFHRNMEISARYAWMYTSRPSCFKWAAMAALASHHVRHALHPFWIDTDRDGHADIERSLHRRERGLLLKDADTIRATNNGIYNDIFWAHLAYSASPNGIEQLRSLASTEPDAAPLLAGFEAIDEGRRALEGESTSAAVRRDAEDRVWEGNVLLLEHEQRVLVQPHFDHLSCAYARLLSMGSVTTFEVRGVRQEASYFTSFYLSSLQHAIPRVFHAMGFPRMTRFDDRWNWIVTSIVPRFRRFDTAPRLLNESLQRIFDEARHQVSKPCLANVSHG